MLARQVITFCIGQQYLGIDIMAVREIRAWSSASLIPHAPDYVFGVVNLRGAVLPVIDLSARLGWGITIPAERHVIIVVELAQGLQGFVVDAVNDIVMIADGALQPPPTVGSDAAASFLEGLAHWGERMIMVLALSNLECEPISADLMAA